MLFIDQNNKEVQFALKEHFNNVRCLIWKKIGAKNKKGESKKCGKGSSCKICNGNIGVVDNIPPLLFDFLSDDVYLELLICGDPDSIQILDIEFWETIFPHFSYPDWTDVLVKQKKQHSEDEESFMSLVSPYFKSIKKIIDYKGWFVQNEPSNQYSAYHLATYLNKRSCIYCNRTYTVTQFKKEKDYMGKLIRPQFDHWFPQERFPLLALSFFNLIPSCSICNSSVKGRKQFALSNYIHPYMDDYLENIVFSYKQWETINRYKIEVTAVHDDEAIEKRIQNTLDSFYLEEMYNAHHSELDDLVKTKQAYSENYLQTLKDSFPNAGLTDQEIYRMAFGVELDKEDFSKRPMSKFKYDILKELGIIKP